jgi:hypothetical protein
MKKLAILIIALALVVGMAMAVCPFDVPDVPQGYAPEDGITNMGYSMTAAGNVVGSANIREMTAFETEGGLYSSKVQSMGLMASGGNIQFARTVEAYQDGYDSGVLANTAVSYTRLPSMLGGAATGSEGVYSTMMANPVNDPNSTTGINPFCESISSKFMYSLTSGSVATQATATSAILPDLPNALSLAAAVDGTGSASMFSRINAMQGTTTSIDNMTRAVPFASTDYEARIRTTGKMETAYEFSYAATHGTGIPQGFPYSYVMPICG